MPLISSFFSGVLSDARREGWRPSCARGAPHGTEPDWSRLGDRPKLFCSRAWPRHQQAGRTRKLALRPLHPHLLAVDGRRNARRCPPPPFCRCATCALSYSSDPPGSVPPRRESSPPIFCGRAHHGLPGYRAASTGSTRRARSSRPRGRWSTPRIDAPGWLQDALDFPDHRRAVVLFQLDSNSVRPFHFIVE